MMGREKWNSIVTYTPATWFKVRRQKEEKRLTHRRVSCCCTTTPIPHAASVTRDLKQRFRWNVLGHPPYSLDLAPSDFYVFEQSEKHLAGCHFRTDDEVQEAVVKWFRDLDSDFFCAGFDRLVYRWHKYFNNPGDYVEK
ncbi:hypothetical protein AVEN_201151-1 [Araneus ventricosus]|uniref:Histone-lysine N-methyltransferase SETMAR n=1 Tax=Araneus ventricosus TaxID=182803 RepID=A0A4Y2FGZ9_ARAVE|nr:hypothetical protein AVEN_201151-1 [Araneus ventricosus]